MSDDAPRALRVLIIEDSEDDALLLVRALQQAGYAPEHRRVETADALDAALDEGGWDLVLADFRLPHFSAPAALELVKRRGEDLPFIIVSGTVTEETALEALRAGAHDFMSKQQLTRLGPAVERELSDLAARRQRAEVQAELRRSEERFRLVTEATRAGVWDLDVRARKVWHSREYAEQFGPRPGEHAIDIEDWLERIHPEDRKRAMGSFREAAASRSTRVWQAEYRLRRGAGYAWVRDRAYLIRDDAGELTRAVGSLVDITKEREAEETRARLAAIVESSDDSIVAVDPEGRILTWNAGAERMFGYGAEEMVGRDYRVIFPPELRGEDTAGRAIREGRGFSTESVRIARSGKRIPVWITVWPIRDASGRVLGAAGTLRDITEAKQTEAELRHRTRELTERIKELRCLYAVSNTLRDPATHTDLGAVLDRVAALVPEGLQRPELACARIVFDDAEHRGPGYEATPAPVRQPIRVADRELGFVELGYRAPPGGGAPPEFLPEELELLAAIADRIAETVERTGAERELARSEEYFRSLIEHGTEMIGLIDADGRVAYISPSVETILGYSREDRLGTDAFDIVHPEDRARMQQVLQRGVAEGRPTTTVEYRARHRDGHWVRLETVATNLLDDPAVGGIVVNTRDVSARYELESQLRQSQKMEAIGRLAGGIAHDFNNLLTVIQGHLELLLGDLPASSVLVEDAREARQAAERAAALTRRLLTFSRKTPIQAVLADMNELIREQGRMLARLIGEDVRLETKLAPELDAVRVDPAQIEQVIMNLAVNARDAMPDGGRLIIETRRVALGGQAAVARSLPTGDYVGITVTDTGTGMPPDVQVRIFEPFFTTKPTGKGTGLGLATAYGIVQQAGGDIGVRSVPGRGTTFEILLPVAGPAAAEPEQSAAPEQTPPHPNHNDRVILLVDDETGVRSLARRVLEREGFTVLDAGDPETALTLAREREGPIHLLLTDIRLQDMTGPELARRIGELYPDAPVLFTSGYLETELEGVDTANAAFLPKPFTPDALIVKVRHTISPDDPSAVAPSGS